jgi:hypothetical protein
MEVAGGRWSGGFEGDTEVHDRKILGCAGYHGFRSILLGVLTFHG